MLQFTTKADTLRALYGQLKAAEVLPQVCLTAGEAEKDPGQERTAWENAHRPQQCEE